MLQRILKEIVKKTKKTNPIKNNVKNFRYQESEEVGLSLVRAGWKLIQSVYHQNGMDISFSAEPVRNTNKEKAGWLVGMGAEDCHFSDESWLEAAQHAYFHKTLGTAVSEVGEEMAHKLWTSCLRAKAKPKERTHWADLTVRKTLAGLFCCNGKYDERHNSIIAKLNTPSHLHDSTLSWWLSWEDGCFPQPREIPNWSAAEYDTVLDGKL